MLYFILFGALGGLVLEIRKNGIKGTLDKYNVVDTLSRW